jgi:formylglycine-generating enzyme required for sulfatase activity/tRNA A-37 threonylcarbamoyl transferase component Bud32
MTDSLSRLTSALSDRYTIERELGAGGMATVYLAHDQKHERKVALKVLRPELAAVLGAERFVQEIKTTANLQHPHILPLFDSGETDGFLYYVMPFINGETLRDRLNRETQLCIDEAAKITVEVADALDYAHRHNVIHRDIKPENILLHDGRAMVADFGIALALAQGDATRLTATGLAVGTAAYMSPEQIDGKTTIDGRSDVYALGCVLYEMLVGEPPFSGPTVQAVIAASITDPVPSARKRREEVSGPLDAAVRRAMAKEADQRFESVRDFADAMVLPKMPAARPRWMMVAMGILVLVVVGLGFGAWRNARVSGARDLLSQVAQLAAAGDFTEAYQLATSAERFIPDDSELNALMVEVSDYLSVSTEPPGARVLIEPFATPAGTNPSTEFIGLTPIERFRIPRTDHRVIMTLDGYVAAERIASSSYSRISQEWVEVPVDNGRAIALDIPMQLAEESTQGMILVPGGPYRLVSPDAPPDAVAELADYVLDRFEVTNAAYRSFVLAGGYGDDRFWTDAPTEMRGRWTDLTGLAGPREWVGQKFPDGEEDHPVTGITWYEASAFCLASGKRLPTIFEWEKASRDGLVTHLGVIMPWGYMNAVAAAEDRANFNSDGPGPVHAYPFGIGPYGAYALAGNVKEWLLNRMGDGYVVTGGSWEDPAYVFPNYASYPATLSSAALGFRCARPRTSEGADQGTFQIDLDERTPEYTPVDRVTFRTLLTHYQYDRRPANPRSRATIETAGWTRERLWIDGIDGDSVLVYFYVPSQARPPYQTVVHVPGASVFFQWTLPEETEWAIGPVIQGGRAVLAVVLKGMMERGHGPAYSTPPTNSIRFRDEMVRHATELRLGIDYLEERDDVDMARLSYVSVSWGGGSRLGFAAVDDRFRAVVFIGGGIDERVKPTLPEADNVNFAPYIDVPKLLLNGRNDEEHPWYTRALPLWNLLEEPKELLLVEGAGHVPPLEARIPAINDFLDRMLGPVSRR